VRCWLLARIFKTAEQQGATARTGARYNMESTDMGHASAQFLGGPNMLTGPTDDYWRAVRKAVAPAFSAKSMRCAHPLASACAQRRALRRCLWCGCQVPGTHAVARVPHQSCADCCAGSANTILHASLCDRRPAYLRL